MILPDLNLLVYAHLDGAPQHARARAWWEALMTGPEPVGLPLAVMIGFVRLMTNPRIVDPPLPLPAAVDEVKRWLGSPNVIVLDPTSAHWDRLVSIGWTGARVSDAHLAALAKEHNCDLHSSDTGFGQCPELRWKNPLID